MLLDTGIRRVTDSFKVLALGAKGVVVGRLFAWGLALAGERGVRDVLANFMADLGVTLAVAGYASVSELDPSAVTARDAGRRLERTNPTTM